MFLHVTSATATLISSSPQPATQARVEEDFNDGQLMNVTGTPTFFLDGERLKLTQLSDLTDAIDSAIGQ